MKYKIEEYKAYYLIDYVYAIHHPRQSKVKGVFQHHVYVYEVVDIVDVDPMLSLGAGAGVGVNIFAVNATADLA